ncbi:MAG: hypothetical protein REI09_01740 [Candidatus Dactylopiibacterium sp.]|nr:hypothetical protein [Candidatus Dactylopiibacterium sp.]
MIQTSDLHWVSPVGMGWTASKHGLAPHRPNRAGTTSARAEAARRETTAHEYGPTCSSLNLSNDNQNYHAIIFEVNLP